MKLKKTMKPPRSIKKAFPQVTTIIDAKKAVQIHVTDKDCKSAEPLNPTECAMARAAKREFKVDAVVIGVSTSYLIKGKKATRFNTPESVAREIVSFDRHSDFQPGNYQLVPKSPTNRLNHRSGPKKPNKNHQAIRQIHHKTTKIREFGVK